MKLKTIRADDVKVGDRVVVTIREAEHCIHHVNMQIEGGRGNLQSLNYHLLQILIPEPKDKMQDDIWTCPNCHQANSGWAKECGRCSRKKSSAIPFSDSHAETITQLKVQMDDAWAALLRLQIACDTANHHWVECRERWQKAVMENESV